VAFFDQLSTTSMPTQTQRDQYRYASEALTALLDELRAIDADVAEIESALDATGAPWTPGRIPQWPPDGG